MPIQVRRRTVLLPALLLLGALSVATGRAQGTDTPKPLASRLGRPQKTPAAKPKESAAET